ncbi:hypothetical protein [Chromatium okenii]|nr:hypothetical protein [Chromatium okenii]MBV5311512.1 hypothetical protein [Chromatium okenii]
MRNNSEIIEMEVLKVTNILRLSGIDIQKDKNNNTLSINCSDTVKINDILGKVYAKYKVSDYCWSNSTVVIVLYRKIWDTGVVIKFFIDNLLDSSTPYPKKAFFSPITQTYLLHQRNFNTEECLSVYSSLNTQWQALTNSNKTTFLYDIKKENFEDLANSAVAFYASKHDGCVVHSQPIWNLSERFKKLGNDREDSIGEDNWNIEHHSNSTLPEENRPHPCRKWRMEMLAYYSPAHTNRRDAYGIHLTQRGIAKVAFQVHEQCSNEPLEIVVLATAYMLLAHEICHAWIEDLCCLFDFFDGENAPKSKRRYARINNRFNGYIFMEEAICNTAAYGFLYKHLTEHQENLMPLFKTSTIPTFIPPFNADRILNAFENWMMKQPKGYKNFVAIQETPAQSELFIENMCRLLVEIYRVNHYSNGCNYPRCIREITQIINGFFGLKNQQCCDNLCSAQPPVYIAR